MTARRGHPRSRRSSGDLSARESWCRGRARVCSLMQRRERFGRKRRRGRGRRRVVRSRQGCFSSRCRRPGAILARRSMRRRRFARAARRQTPFVPREIRPRDRAGVEGRTDVWFPLTSDGGERARSAAARSSIPRGVRGGALPERGARRDRGAMRKSGAAPSPRRQFHDRPPAGRSGESFARSDSIRRPRNRGSMFAHPITRPTPKARL